MAEQILVRFEGESEGAGELTWGQRYIWHPMRLRGSSLSLSAVHRVGGGITVRDIVDELRFYFGAYQTLRTRLRFDAGGGLRQVVERAGEFSLPLVETGGEEPAAVGESLVRRFEATPFDYPREWPIRAAVVCQRGRPVGLVTTISHFALDGAAAGVVFGGRDPASRRPRAPVAAPQPLELARIEAGPAAQRSHQAAMGYWQRVLRTIPPDRFPVRDAGVRRYDGRGDRRSDGLGYGSGGRSDGRGCGSGGPSDGRGDGSGGRSDGPGARRAGGWSDWQDGEHRGGPADREPRYRQASLESPALWLAQQVVAARTRTGAGAVLLAAFAVGLARVSAPGPVVTQVIVSNRFRPGLADVVAPVSQSGLCVLDLERMPFDDAVRRAANRTMTAFKHAYYDRPRLQELIEAVEHERGTRVDLGCFYNDRRPVAGATPAGPLPDAAWLRAARAASRLSWDPPLETFNEKLMAHVSEAGRSVNLLVQADTHYLPAEEMAALLREMESAVVEAAVTGG